MTRVGSQRHSEKKNAETDVYAGLLVYRYVCTQTTTDGELCKGSKE
jgi:hypothetical protein